MNKSYLIFLSVILLVLSFINLSIGSQEIGFVEVLDILQNKDSNPTWSLIFWEYRIPKLLAAILAGAGLACSGLLMQTLFRNPLAGPYVLGISSGASFGVALFVMAGSSLAAFSIYPVLYALGVSFAALLGSFLILFAMYWSSKKLYSGFSVLILGLILGQVLGALQSGLSFVASPGDLKEFVLWGMGSFSQVSFPSLIFMLVIVVFSLWRVYTLRYKLDIYLLGDLYAKSMGLDLRKFRTATILATGLLSGVITAFCGPIAFIGLAVPHVSRFLIKTHEHKQLFWVVLLLGAIIAVLSDTISHAGIGNQVIPINILTSILGGPVALWIILSNNKKHGEV